MKFRGPISVFARAFGLAALFFAPAPTWAGHPETEVSRVLTSADNGRTVVVTVGTTIAVEFAATPGSLVIWELDEAPPFLTPAGAHAGDGSEDGRLRVQYMFRVDDAGVGALVFRGRLLSAAGRTTKPSGDKIWQAVINAE